MIALSALYIAFALDEKLPPDSYRLRGRNLTPVPTVNPSDVPIYYIQAPLTTTTSTSTTPDSNKASTGPGSPPQVVRLLTRAYAPRFFASLDISVSLLFTIVQSLISIYPVWDSLISRDPLVDKPLLSSGGGSTMTTTTNAHLATLKAFHTNSSHAAGHASHTAAPSVQGLPMVDESLAAPAPPPPQPRRRELVLDAQEPITDPDATPLSLLTTPTTSDLKTSLAQAQRAKALSTQHFRFPSALPFDPKRFPDPAGKKFFYSDGPMAILRSKDVPALMVKLWKKTAALRKEKAAKGG